MRAEIAHDRKGDPETYAHVWLGEYNTRSDAQVFSGRYQVEEFTPGPGWDGPYFGADWGFAVDPTVLVKCWIAPDGRVAIEKESGKVGLDIDRTGELWAREIPEAQAQVIRSDSARPETISYLQRHGWPRVTSVDKWKGSVEDGVDWLRAKGLLIHPQCFLSDGHFAGPDRDRAGRRGEGHGYGAVRRAGPGRSGSACHLCLWAGRRRAYHDLTGAPR